MYSRIQREYGAKSHRYHFHCRRCSCYHHHFDNDRRRSRRKIIVINVSTEPDALQTGALIGGNFKGPRLVRSTWHQVGSKQTRRSRVRLLVSNIIDLSTWSRILSGDGEIIVFTTRAVPAQYGGSIERGGPVMVQNPSPQQPRGVIRTPNDPIDKRFMRIEIIRVTLRWIIYDFCG